MAFLKTSPAEPQGGGRYGSAGFTAPVGTGSLYCTLIESTFTVLPSMDPDTVAVGVVFAGLPLRAVEALEFPEASSLKTFPSEV